MDIYEAMEKFRQKGKRAEYYQCVYNLYMGDPEGGYKYLREFRADTKKHISENPEKNMELLKASYTLSATEKLDDFIIAMEWDRANKFYLPRRKCLLPLVEAIQDLEDDKIDLACISCPPGIGKTGIALFALSWIGGRHPEEGNLIASHNNSFLAGAYGEVLREVQSEEYRFREIFPSAKVASTNAKDMQIALLRAKRFPTFQFTSIGAGNAGKVRAVHLLYCDDLISDIEEAMSKERLDKKWQSYTVDLKQRKQGNCKELHIATRWSVHDIIGRLEQANEGNERARFVSMPALDAEGNSNFDYGGSDGFTTAFYEDIKGSMDEVSWKALYMNEPIEREGLLYPAEELRRYYELPNTEPDAIIGVCDTAEGGGDDTVMPIFAVYGSDHYLVDCVCSNALPEITDNLCAELLCRLKVKSCQFESNSAGGRTADKVAELVKGKGHYCHITKKRTTQNKQTKIIVESSWVKVNCLFKDISVITKGSMYDSFMRKLCSYTVMGKNKHDDVPDAISQYSIFYNHFLGSPATLISRKNLGF